jgi:hypothetical protein
MVTTVVTANWKVVTGGGDNLGDRWRQPPSVYGDNCASSRFEIVTVPLACLHKLAVKQWGFQHPYRSRSKP